LPQIAICHSGGVCCQKFWVNGLMVDGDVCKDKDIWGDFVHPDEHAAEVG
jgi:hypothetical protein